MTMNTSTIRPLDVVPKARRRARPFALWIAGFCAVLVLAGFARTFYLQPLLDGPPLPWLAIVHGVVMSLWIVLFAAQAWLVSRHDIRLHRTLGMLGTVLVPAMLVLGLAMGIGAMRAGHSPSPLVTPRQFLAVPVFNILLFAALAGTGLWLRRRPDIHRRLMLLALLDLLPPALARLPLDAVRSGGLPLVMVVTALVVLACIARDTAVHRRLHPVFVAGGVAVMLALPASVLVAHTAWWQRVAQLLA
jgi:hypothetical protein